VVFATKCHTENSLQMSYLCRLFFWQYPFSRRLRLMTTGEDRKNDQFKNWKLCGLWKLPFRHHGAITLTQKCVWFTNPCINSFVPTSVTREYHPKVLERLHLLQCISAHLKNTLPWASWETQYLNLFSAEFRSCLVARSRKPTKCVLKTLLRRSTHVVPIRPQKANGSSYSSQQWHLRRRVCDCLPNSYRPSLFKLLKENHISYCRTVRGLEILRNVIFSGYITFYQINTFFVNILFFIIGKMCLRAESTFDGLLFPTHSLRLSCQRAGWVGVPNLTLSPGAWNPRYATAWCRLWKGVVTAHTIVAVQHQRWTVVVELRRHWHNPLIRNIVTWRPARGTRQRRTTTTPPKAFHEEPGCMPSRDRQNMCRRFWHTPGISRKFAGEWKFVL